ncbi:MAG: hypothetical protein ABIG63_16320 [Chloroflexota bacterium]
MIEKLKALALILRRSITDAEKQLHVAVEHEDWVEAGTKAAYLRGLQFALTGIYTIWDAPWSLPVTASTAEQSTTTSAQVETTDTEPFEDRVYADADDRTATCCEKCGRYHYDSYCPRCGNIATDTRPSGYRADPLAYWEQDWFLAEQAAQAARQVDVEFGFDDRTAMADSHDSAGV